MTRKSQFRAIVRNGIINVSLLQKIFSNLSIFGLNLNRDQNINQIVACFIISLSPLVAYYFVISVGAVFSG
jgi:carbamoylphosphate synthase large subunit